MEEFFVRVWQDLAGRLSGPMQFRLFLQPAMAVIFATRGAIQDARDKRPPYFWALFTSTTQRKELLKQGWTAIGKVLTVALIMDAVYQAIVLRWFYPGEAVIVAFILAVVPYLLVRGPLNRVLRVFQGQP